MLRISKMADYGTVIMATLVHASEPQQSAAEIAQKTQISLPTVSKLLKRLTRAGLLVSERGAYGGYRLAREPKAISVVEILNAIETKQGLTECSEGHSHCVLQAVCPTKANWGVINQVVVGALKKVSLSALADESCKEIMGQNVGKNESQQLDKLLEKDYEHGFVTDIESESIAPGLNEDVIRLISSKKNEPEFLLEWRLKAYEHWLTMPHPEWSSVHYPPIDYQAIAYYSAPKSKADAPKSLDEVDPELLKTYEKLGIPLEEQKWLAGVAVDAVFDSVSVATTFKEKLAEYGVIFCSFSEAVQTHPELIKQYLGTVVPYRDNFYATLNSAVFSDGSFVYIPKGVRCPMELSTYFRINAASTGQFERTLIVADEDSYVSYLEGCTAPMRDENQLHAAVVELVALKGAQIKYSTVQNWYPGDKEGKGGIYNFVTKRGACRGKKSKISWTQIETGSAITWKYPSVVLQGDESVGEFYSVALTNNFQQADTGSKMIHIGKNTKSTIISKGISAGRSHNAYRGLVRIAPTATGARNFTQCDSMLMGDKCSAHTYPYIEAKEPSAQIEHEATTSKISEDQLFYCEQRGIETEDAVSMIVNGFCKEVLKELPMEFAVEAQKLLGISLEGSVG